MTRPDGAAADDRTKPDDGFDDGPGGAARTPGQREEDEIREAEERFKKDLIERGEAVPEGAELPPGATHEITVNDDGEEEFVRRRFSLY